MYTLDTNAILYYLKDDADAVSILRDVFAENVPVYVSAVTELELFAYSDLSTEEESLIEKLLATISVIPVDSRIARPSSLKNIPAELSDIARAKGRPQSPAGPMGGAT